ncbi:MAG TPA: quinolinate synthase NadA [Gemmatimonadales bacterium]|nr:quinolinate synthase NadA [Gemmatimonadales bacterium]
MSLQLPVIDQHPYPAEDIPGLQQEIRELARKGNAIILAHNYQRSEVQDVADFVGDSLGLARRAANVEEEVIVFCGVHFMAETAKVLSPGKTVLLPDLEAGCSLADTITAEEVRGWRREFPDYVAVGYVNTTAAVKAELDYCCTSGNVLDVIDAIPADKGILFLPDMFLGAHVRRMRPERKVEVWMGECHVHAGIDVESLQAARDANPRSEVLVHPECGCASRLLYRMADGDLPPEGIHIASTEGMINLTRTLDADTFIVATETGIIHRMRQAAPGKRFVPADRAAECAYMKTITLLDVRDSLRLSQHRIEVPLEIRERALGAIERMVSLGA